MPSWEEPKAVNDREEDLPQFFSTKPMSDEYKQLPLNVRMRIARGDLNQDCALCLDTFNANESVVTMCGHAFCANCLRAVFQINGVGKEGQRKTDCPVCRAPCNENLLVLGCEMVAHRTPVDPPPKPAAEPSSKRPHMNEEAKLNMDMVPRPAAQLQASRTSSKAAAVVDYVINTLQEMPSAKIVVISQWNSMLAKIDALFLENSGAGLVKFAHFESDMTWLEREEMLNCFQHSKSSDNPISVLLWPLKSASLVKNHADATHIIFVDPSLMPAGEVAALCNFFQIGRTHPIEAIHFCVRDSLEEKILSQRENGSMIDANRLTLDQLCELIR
jgi:SNF2 family DNA or RNA helicase